MAQTLKPAPAANDQSGPTAATAAQDWPNRIFQTLREFKVRHVTYVPDAGHSRLIELCHTAGDMEPTVLTTEEEDRHLGRRLARRRARRPADAKQRRRQLHQHAVARQGAQPA